MKRILSSVALPVAVWALSTVAALAQPTTGGPAPGTPAVDPTQTPIDGGVSLLLAGGVAYGLRRLRARKAH